VNTLIGLLTSWVKAGLGFCMGELILILTFISAVGSAADYFLAKTGRPVKGRFHDIFKTNSVYLLTKCIALAIVFMHYFDIGPELIAGNEVSGKMIDLGKTLIALAISFSYLLPFLTDAGLMEFTGEITKPFVRPMFMVPSDASLDLIASWLGASNAAVLLSAEKYRKGYYTKREAAIVMCNFSLVSIPFCMVIATTAGIENCFPFMYALLCILGVVLAVILPRIYPLKGLKDEYFCTPIYDSRDYAENNMLRRATARGCTAAESFTGKKLLNSGTNLVISICINLLPIVIAWGALGLLLVSHTPVLKWISMPMGWFLDVMGVEEAYTAAPATLAGFVDMFIPVLLITGIESARTRFIIATLSLIQIIYITEVGAVIIQPALGVDLKKLFLIFLERTLLSLPLIVFASLLIF
ncbi:MAG: hypothetical protein GX488_06740, partial [Clostridiales bacterium]|nr:hypothetical protein [Clostridiales bacterium]